MCTGYWETCRCNDCEKLKNYIKTQIITGITKRKEKKQKENLKKWDIQFKYIAQLGDTQDQALRGEKTFKGGSKWRNQNL